MGFEPFYCRATYQWSSGGWLLCTLWKLTMSYLTQALETRYSKRNTQGDARTYRGSGSLGVEQQSFGAKT
eukprot:2056616-Rhodomonas_salina.1